MFPLLDSSVTLSGGLLQPFQVSRSRISRLTLRPCRERVEVHRAVTESLTTV